MMRRILLLLLAALLLPCWAHAGATYLGVQGGGIFGEEDFDAEGAVLTGDVGYLFKMGLWLEYEGGGVGEDFDDHSWSRVGYEVMRRGASSVLAGAMKLDLTDEDAGYGGWASLLYRVTNGTALRLTAEKAESVGVRVGWYVTKQDSR